MEYLLQIVALLVLISWWIISNSRSKSRLPTQFANLKPIPGPKGLPFIGNALAMPRIQEWKVFKEWSHIYGNIFKVSVFGRTIIVVNSFDIAIELTEKRGAIYSSRPRLIMAGKLMGFNATYPLMPYNDGLRAARRLAHHTLSPRPVKSMLHVPEEEGGRWLRRLLNNPKDWKQSVAEVNGAVTTKIVYGYQAGGEKDPMVKAFEVALHAFSLAIAPGAHLVDFFPSLQKVPSWLFRFGFRELADHGKDALMYSVDASWTFVHNQIAAGVARQSMALDSLNLIQKERNQKASADMDEVAKWTAAATAGAGAHTPVSALMFWVLAMVAHPHVQKKAQEELDRVVGRDRLPNLSDRPNLPYIEAILKEVLRWHPVTPCGVPHTSSEDDEYEGMFIPKGTSIILNQWAMLHDPAYFSEPEKFLPERFLGDSPADQVRAGNPYAIAFGFGRRICPGLHLGSVMMYCFISKALSTFDIKRPISAETGKEFDPPVDAAPGNVSFPVEFDCRFVARDQKAIDLINRDTEELVAGEGMPSGFEVPPESHSMAHHW
ncbi:MAG: cytochrome P450 [Lentinula lateritia]|nr:MAG: cytochrome P450 [Lentinula lateritia]